ncbi:hypothetical protein [Actibacterium sp. 188UL27-1]|uniref:hypothetical protein n=1 Tax=Actibacterium sp. 188UL27-1 TaxID=2786961 RepID=UPI0019573BE2|nr:hypothetical protein [Actibacterium sp. 188UL27-1]MBM7069246.1 hypothetical protein [Actibacterium sp. 188UL27-1]
MESLIWIGALLSVVGLAGIIWCIVDVSRARRAGLDDDTLRARLQKAVAFNLGAFGISALGLIMVVMGLILS